MPKRPVKRWKLFVVLALLQTAPNTSFAAPEEEPESGDTLDDELSTMEDADFPDLVAADETGDIMDELDFLQDAGMVELAARHQQEIGMSPSAITVITREEIEAWYGTGENSAVVPRNGEAWDRAADGSVVILEVEDFMIEVTLDDASQCPSMPSMNNGVPIIYRIAADTTSSSTSPPSAQATTTTSTSATPRAGCRGGGVSYRNRRTGTGDARRGARH